MREREELRGHIHALTAQQRFGGMIVGLLPLWAVGFLAIASPDFISPLWEDGVGHLLLGIGATMEIVGFFAMRQILKIEV
jgi:tight adherence protein B